MAAAAYRAGEKLQSEYYGTTADYTRKSGVVHKEIFLPANAPEKYRDRETLWNAVEYAEKNPRAQLAYSFNIALQNELSMEENIALARAFVQELLGEDPVTIKVWQDKLARIQQERSDLYLEYAPQQDFLMQLWRIKNRLDSASKQLNQPEKAITREESMRNPYEQTEEP